LMFQNFCRLWSLFWNRQEIMNFCFEEIVIRSNHRTYSSERLQHIQYEHMMTNRITELAKQSNMLVNAGYELLDRYEFKQSDAERRYQKITQVFNCWCIEQLGKKRLRHLTSRALSLWSKRVSVYAC
jgi:hypothetical protein